MKFPPYGVLPLGFFEQAEDATPPSHFNSQQGVGEDWNRWLRDIIGTLNECLWPSWNSHFASWSSPDYVRMDAITETDFRMLREFQENRILSESSPVSTNVGTSTHLDHFLDEDEGRFGHRLREYLPELAIGTEININELIARKAGATSQVIKNSLQRPRPHQMAILSNKLWFRWNYATTAHSPSMCSGHALQGVLIATGLFELLGDQLSSEGVRALAQFGADVGDRRVFAGVHYPSDNLASWIVGSSLARHVFPPKARAFLRLSIHSSLIFKQLIEGKRNYPHLQTAFDVLDEAIAS